MVCLPGPEILQLGGGNKKGRALADLPFCFAKREWPINFSLTSSSQPIPGVPYFLKRFFRRAHASGMRPDASSNADGGTGTAPASLE